MTRPTTIRARFEPTDGETYEVEVSIPFDYPDALDQAEKSAVRTIERMIAFAKVTYGTD